MISCQGEYNYEVFEVVAVAAIKVIPKAFSLVSVQAVVEYRRCVLDPNLDQYVGNHPFTGIGVTERGAQFAGTIGSWLLSEPI